MIATIYARESSELCLSGWIVAAWRGMDWTAVSAMATFAAVIVALIPIFREWRRRRAIAEGLRVQLLVQLFAILLILEKRRGGPAAIVEPLTSYERQPIEALQSLLSQLHILTPKEAQKLRIAVMSLALFSRMSPSVLPSVLHQAVDDVEFAIEALGGPKVVGAADREIDAMKRKA